MMRTVAALIASLIQIVILGATLVAIRIISQIATRISGIISSIGYNTTDFQAFRVSSKQPTSCCDPKY